MKCDDYKLDPCRDKVFDRLCEVWTETKKANSEAWQIDIWRKANTLQAVALYWHTTTDGARQQKAMNLMLDAYKFYGTRKSDQSLWVDDFGWWAGFFGDLYGYTGAFPLGPPFDPANLLVEIQYCYRRMLNNLDPDGGIWNHKEGSEQERNTVTNGWMLNVASNLFFLTGGDVGYRQFAEAQYKWLTTGKYGSYSPPSWVLYAPNGLLLWLPGPTNTAGTTYWSGDEGVFLRGLNAYINLVTDPTIKKELLRDSKNLINAAMKTFADPDHVMHASPNSPDPTSNDLATGKGVFMRLVTRSAIYHKFFADNAFETTFKQFVNATAESVWCSCDKTTAVTGPNWNPAYNPSGETGLPTSGDLWPQVWQTDGLDALNAAVQIRAAA